MPSTRTLAADMGVSRRLVVECYEQLVAEGYLVSRRGSGTTVAWVDSTRRGTSGSGESKPRVRYDVDFTPGTPDLTHLPVGAWVQALRQGLAEAPTDSFGYRHPQGLPVTRQAVASYLRRTRGVMAEVEQLVICSGVTQAIALLAQIAPQIDAHPLAIEDPGFWLHPLIMRQHNMDPIPVPVDDQGLDIDALSRSSARAVLCTPAHQSAIGVVMAPDPRAALLEWARSGNLVIEDDYDAEYRYDRAPVGALQGLAPEHVIYAGSLSKTVAPGLRLGWVVVPPPLVESMSRAKALADIGTSVMDQLAFGKLLDSGHYDRHLRAMRRRYRRRRDALLQALAEYLPHATVLGAAAGLQLTIVLPKGTDVDALARRADAARVRVEPLHRCYADPLTAPPGLILGYANLTPAQMVRGVQVLSQNTANHTAM